MKLTILQRGGKKIAHDFYEEAMRSFAAQLLSPARVALLDVRVEFRKTTVLSHADGQCTLLGRNKFEIRVRRDLPFGNILLILAHEFVHVKQFATQELTWTKEYDMTPSTRKFWNGVEMTDVPYAERPWEIEAEARELDLTKAFLNRDFHTKVSARRLQAYLGG